MIKIKFFANFREIVGARTINMKENNITIKELLNNLCEIHKDLRNALFDTNGLRDYVKIMVNGRSIAFLNGINTILQDGDVVAIFPPVAGG